MTEATKAIIERNTGIAPIDEPDRPIIMAYPVYAPDTGVTLRVDLSDSVAPTWVDVTIEDAQAIAEDILSVIKEVSMVEAPVEDDWRKPTAIITRWMVDQWDPERDPEDKKDMVPVINNHSDKPVVWFKKQDNASEIVDRLNQR